MRAQDVETAAELLREITEAEGQLGRIPVPLHGVQHDGYEVEVERGDPIIIDAIELRGILCERVRKLRASAAALGLKFND